MFAINGSAMLRMDVRYDGVKGIPFKCIAVIFAAFDDIETLIVNHGLGECFVNKHLNSCPVTSARIQYLRSQSIFNYGNQ
jgi:hypothetical protein